MSLHDLLLECSKARRISISLYKKTVDRTLIL